MAAHYSLVLRSWDDMMPVVRVLGGGPLLPRHIHMLLAWLHVSRCWFTAVDNFCHQCQTCKVFSAVVQKGEREAKGERST